MGTTLDTDRTGYQHIWELRHSMTLISRVPTKGTTTLAHTRSLNRGTRGVCFFGLRTANWSILRNRRNVDSIFVGSETCLEATKAQTLLKVQTKTFCWFRTPKGIPTFQIGAPNFMKPTNGMPSSGRFGSFVAHRKEPEHQVDSQNVWASFTASLVLPKRP